MVTITADLKTNLPFYHLWQNIFLIKTPTNAQHYTSLIEDCFHPSLLHTEIGGKKFNLKKGHDAPNEYGKFVFAEQVVKPHATKIDFSGFSPLLERIVAAIDWYENLKQENAKQLAMAS